MPHTLYSRIKPSKEALLLEDLITEEKKIRGESIKQEQRLENIEKTNKIRNQEKLIDDLMFGEENADQILEQHREQVEEQTKKTTLFSHAGEEAKAAQEHQLVTLLPDPPFHYKDIITEYLGPSPPDYKMLEKDGYTKNIMKATACENAGGYVEITGCMRAVQEAMMGLYFDPSVQEHVIE